MYQSLTLAIETGIEGGSVSIVRKGFEIDFFEGDKKISRSDELLANISRLLAKNGFIKKDIKGIAVSRGPGSFTGIRTGIATAKGLQKAFRCDLISVTVLEALVLKTTQPGEIFTGFAIGKNEICWQVFESDGKGLIKDVNTPQISTITNVIQELRKYQIECLIIHKNIFSKFPDLFGKFKSAASTEVVSNAAKYIALRSTQTFGNNIITPLYARDNYFR